MFRIPRSQVPIHLRQYFRPAAIPHKSLMLLPERYRIRAVDELGLIARAVVIWSKPNGLPESVTDRVRRSHEDWVHLTKQPRYFSAVDEIREAHAEVSLKRAMPHRANIKAHEDRHTVDMTKACNPLGKLPGSVWEVPTQPLCVPEHLGVDHFAAFPMEWPRRIITGWSPRDVCSACGEGRRPVVERERTHNRKVRQFNVLDRPERGVDTQGLGWESQTTITGHACACPDTSAPTTHGVVLDPFGGTGTTALVADVLGRDAIHVDLSADYCRLAEWRTTDPGERARAMQVQKPEPVIDGQMDLLEGLTA